jgi:hypothetical protein
MTVDIVKRYTYKNSSGTVVLGGQDIINPDILKVPFALSVLVDVVSGTASFGVEYTTDDISTDEPSNMRWHYTDEIPGGTSDTIRKTIGYPATGIRLNIRAFTGEIRLSVIQGLGTTI